MTRTLKQTVIYGLVLLAGCSSSLLKYNKSEDGLSKNDEFDKQVKISTENSAPTGGFSESASVKVSEPEAEPVAKATPSPVEQQFVGPTNRGKSAPKPVVILKKKKVKVKGKFVEKVVKEVVMSPEDSKVHEPGVENSEGFIGRRPVKDPFRVGEKVTHSVNYFRVKAGELTIETKPFAYVNGKKSYRFLLTIRSSSVFSSFYAVEDSTEILMDYDTLVPSVYTMHVKESGQLKEAKAFFDPAASVAKYWEHKYTKKNGDEEKKFEWGILPFSQNVFSAPFYIRAFTLRLNHEYAFRVADNKENLIFRGKVIRKEKLETAAGTFDSLVIQPQMELQGVFKPVGDIFIWLSDDDRKYILRIESKIKIGTLVSEVTSIEPGNSP